MIEYVHMRPAFIWQLRSGSEITAGGPLPSCEQQYYNVFCFSRPSVRPSVRPSFRPNSHGDGIDFGLAPDANDRYERDTHTHAHVLYV